MIHSRFGSFAASKIFCTSARRHKLVARRVDRAERRGVEALDDRRGAERWLVRRAVRDVDQRVAPSPAQLVEIGQAEADDAGDGCPRPRIRRREHRQAGAFRHADQDRLAVRAARREVREHLVVARLVLGAERGLPRGETFQVVLDVEADDEEAVAGEDFGDVRTEVHPAAVSARHDDRRVAACAVTMQRLRVTANHQRFPGVGRAGLRAPELRVRVLAAGERERHRQQGSLRVSGR